MSTQPISTNTPIPVQTSTLSQKPTLEPKKAKEVIETSFMIGSDCDIPCFLGIFPGETKLGEALDIFTLLGLPVKSVTYNDLDIYGTHYDFFDGLSIYGNLAIQDDNVKNIRVIINPLPPTEGSQREWLVYSPKTLISRYGQPTRVSFVLDWGPRPFFDMVMEFDTVELIVEYTGYDIIPRQHGSPTVCPPTAQFDAVRIWMGKDPIDPPARGVPLEKATSLTMEEFSKLMTEDPDQACFTINGEEFP